MPGTLVVFSPRPTTSHTAAASTEAWESLLTLMCVGTPVCPGNRAAAVGQRPAGSWKPRVVGHTQRL